MGKGIVALVTVELESRVRRQLVVRTSRATDLPLDKIVVRGMAAEEKVVVADVVAKDVEKEDAEEDGVLL